MKYLVLLKENAKKKQIKFIMVRSIWNDGCYEWWKFSYALKKTTCNSA